MFANVIVSCATRPELMLLPESLPAATVGVPYNVPFEVIKTSSPVSGIYVSDKSPLPEGLRIEHDNLDSHGLITGAPLKAGVYEVHVSAGTYGTQCVGLSANRVYTLEVIQ
ncbi:MAG: hypothetical protein VCA39_19905 [Pseudomonas sp.]|uniref:hypothetical protein n=1 Tax=Pseudomonas sp. TaxID=306 RepID=UPI0039829928